MLSKNANTIQQHLETVGNRFELAQIIMHRTRQLMRGSPIKNGVGTQQLESKSHKSSEIPTHLYPKIALEELRQGKLTWKTGEIKNVPCNDPNTIVFGE